MKYDSSEDRNCVLRLRTSKTCRFCSLRSGKRKRSLNCAETAHNINSEGHKGVSGKDCWHLIEIHLSGPAQLRYMVDYQMII